MDGDFGVEVSGVRNLDTILVNRQRDRSAARVEPMGECIDDRLAERVGGDLQFLFAIEPANNTQKVKVFEAERHRLALKLDDVTLDHAVIKEDCLVLALEPRHLQDALGIELYHTAVQKFIIVTHRPPSHLQASCG